MREILFRGKRIDNSEWIEGCFLQGGNKHRPIGRPDVPFSDCYIFEKIDEENDIVDFYGDDDCVYFNIGAYHINPSSVGQFTGLTDKNGKKIFEGDIVTVKMEDSNGEEWEEKSIVQYDSDECFWYPMRWAEECEFCEGWTKITSIEVLGNIHDNPGLLGVNSNG